LGTNTTFSRSPTEGIGVDPAGDVVGQFDDQLGVVIARRGLAAEDLHPRHPVALGMAADLVIERHRLDQVEQLALVFVDALDLHIEQRVGIEPDAGELRRWSQIDLVGALHLGHPLAQRGIAGSASRSASFSASSRKPSPMASRITRVRPGCTACSQRRGVTPLVLLLIRSG
jgi:hypothetical protein